MEVVPLVVLLLLLVAGVPAASGERPQLPASECPTSCGDVEIPYPFGIGRNCSIGLNYTVNCLENADGHDRPFIGGAEIIEIMLAQGKGRVYNTISWNCYDDRSQGTWSFDMSGLPYRFSDADNKFTVIGCDTLAYINGTQGGKPYQSGCMTFCQNDSLADGSGSCAGIGCCQTSVPRGLDYIDVRFDSEHDGSSTRNFSPCSYAVLVQENQFSFQSSYITTTKFLDEIYMRSVPVVVTFAIGNETCEEARRNSSRYACVSQHSECVDSPDAPGYLCNCSSGFQGNPYLFNGCQDINECDRLDAYPCKGDCHNTLGGYNCYCPQGTTGNAASTGCIPIPRQSIVTKVVTGVSGSLIFLLLCGLCFYLVHQRKKLEEIKRRYFEEHGGLDLKKKMKEEQNLEFRIFAIKELEKATNNFDDRQILGKGGNGIVYKGILEDKCTVAIKKPRLIDESLKRGFGNETLILSRINHDNIVKLLGCCLETEMPMLVYEFVPNGTLSHLIHENKNRSSISLDIRLRIAYQSAKALEYLHMEASPSIIHGDIKPSNILLDNDYNAKVSDFGASKLIPKDEQQFATLVQFTYGYIDPECLQTYELTYKSDVYSFGVVLLELFTGRKAIYFEGPEEQRNLVTTFALFMDENHVFDIYDNQVKEEANVELIQELSELIKRCLYLKGEERPTMKEVVEELHTLRKFTHHPWAWEQYEQDNVERESLLEEITTHADGKELNIFFS
ncbi:wall-associated receptor kinase 5-like [Zingiber officinale]|uniref:Protein kinase domain-containing protein n=1 Tax=Zingiber officinale TaxID=94328 RepID=A0A8J5KKF0_ZINOF|nr:wall-associated receptor kinase 5-like [Zingiber officinale]KAG6482957.1 hypothetical protein ZIOFF_059597 [Zingiber officinale]